jgi:N-hydroxyarylamine O-acetyltransferase
MDQELVAAYLRRIGIRPPVRADADTLRELQRCHLETVPFENLGIHLGERIVLDAKLLVDKIIRRGRGGICYELNGAFAALLVALGYRVTMLAGAVFAPGGALGVPFDHLALRVDLDRPWLVDVGFGRHTKYPLLLDTSDEQHNPDGVFRIVTTADGDLDVFAGDRAQYRLETRPRALTDFGSAAWFHQTAPESRFTRGPVCGHLTATGRITLSDHTLIRTDGDTRTEQILTDAQTFAAYRELFGIELDRLPVLEGVNPWLS